MTRHCHLRQQPPWITDIEGACFPWNKALISMENGRGLNKRDMTALPPSLDRPAIDLGPDGMLRWLSRWASPKL
jgi:hypothetical protein